MVSPEESGWRWGGLAGADPSEPAGTTRFLSDYATWSGFLTRQIKMIEMKFV